MKLYFGNAVTAATTIMIIAMLGFIAYTVFNRAEIQCWGRRCLLLLVFGLVICCFAAARDGLDKTIQYTIDGSCDPGIFSLMSLPVIIGCIGALIIIIGSRCNACGKITDRKRNMVLHNVRRSDAQGDYYGDFKTDYTLGPQDNIKGN